MFYNKNIYKCSDIKTVLKVYNTNNTKLYENNINNIKLRNQLPVLS